MLMVALGTTAPDGSVTVPFSSAFSCAQADATHKNVTITTPSAHLTKFICPPKKQPGMRRGFVVLSSKPGAKGRRRRIFSARANHRSHAPVRAAQWRQHRAAKG